MAPARTTTATGERVTPFHRTDPSRTPSGRIHSRSPVRSIAVVGLLLILAPALAADRNDVAAQSPTASTDARWIRPADPWGPPVWGIRDGIVFSLWPYDVETGWPASRMRPRGLIRVGYQQNGLTYLINFIAVEPVVDGRIEYSEISPSSVMMTARSTAFRSSRTLPGQS